MHGYAGTASKTASRIHAHSMKLVFRLCDLGCALQPTNPSKHHVIVSLSTSQLGFVHEGCHIAELVFKDTP